MLPKAKQTTKKNQMETLETKKVSKVSKVFFSELNSTVETFYQNVSTTTVMVEFFSTNNPAGDDHKLPLLFFKTILHYFHLFFLITLRSQYFCRAILRHDAESTIR